MAVKTKAEIAEPRTERGRARRASSAVTLTPLQEIRVVPNDEYGKTMGAWAYYLNPKGATISDVLNLQPNGNDQAPLGAKPSEGGKVPHYAENAFIYQRQMEAAGFEYVGPSLTREAVERMVEIIGHNREDETFDLEDQIAECDEAIKNLDDPKVRQHEKRRRGQLEARLARVVRPIDPEALSAELNEIARAQRMAAIDPNVLAVIREYVGETNARFEQLVKHFAVTGGGGTEDFEGKDLIE